VTTQTLAHAPDPSREAPQLSQASAGAPPPCIGPGGQLALLGELSASGAQRGLDGRWYSPEARSAEPILGTNAEFCAQRETEPPGAKLGGGPAQLVLDLADLEAVPQLGIFERQAVTRRVLREEMGDAGFSSNLHKCDWVRVPIRKDGVVIVYRDERGNYHHSGHVRCQQWCCALCGPKRARSTAATLGVAILRWLDGRRNDAGGRRDRPSRLTYRDVWMLTLTLPHRWQDMPGATVEKLYAAHAAFVKSPAWKAFSRRWGVKQAVRVLDNVHGSKNGTHPHFHIALFVSKARDYKHDTAETVDELGDLLGWRSHYARRAGESKAQWRRRRQRRCDEIGTTLWGAWSDALRDAGVVYPVAGEALKLSPGEQAAAYFTGWGLADEVAATTQKSRSHLRLLDAAAAGVAGAGRAYVEWVAASHGRQWVTGLEDLRQKLDISDGDIEEHTREMREARDAAAAARGEPVQLVKPHEVAIPDGLHAAALSLGWPTVHALCDAADTEGKTPQLVVIDALCEERRRLELLRTRQRAGPARGAAPPDV
jgi:hypothetical protein